MRKKEGKSLSGAADGGRFIAAYPVGLRELISVPMVLREYSPYFEGLPYPTSRIVGALAGYAGYSPGAARTALSRSRASQEILDAPGEGGARRFRVGRLSEDVAKAMEGRKERPRGLTIAVFAFETEHEKERRLVREILSWFGFNAFARNTWINRWMDIDGIEAALAKAGLADHCFLFRSAEPPGESVIRRLRETYGIEERVSELLRFGRDLSDFLGDPELPSRAFTMRFLYAAPVFYKICFIQEPPLPDEALPVDYPLEALESTLDTFGTARGKDLIETWNEMTE